MFPKRGKRGISQADWVISLGIFLIYLAWFFVVIKPVLGPETKESLPSDELKDEFMRNASWQINVTPIIIKSNMTSANEPMIMGFNYGGNAVNYALEEGYWSIDNGRLIFMASFPPSSNMFHLLHSTANYSKPSIASNMQATETSASASDMIAAFKDSLLDNAKFRSNTKINSFELDIDGSLINTAANDFLLTPIFARYRVMAPLVNSTVYVFENNSKMYGFIDTTGEKGINLEFVLDRYDEYYINSQYEGSIAYNVTGCDDFETDHIDFLDEGYGILFVLSEDVNIEMCHDKSLIVSMRQAINGTLSYKIIFHQRSADIQELMEPYTAIFGMAEQMQGLSAEKMHYLQSSDYDSVKEEWGMKHDFNITVFNSTESILFSMGKEPSRNININSKVYYAWLLDRYANQTRAMINILMW